MTTGPTKIPPQQVPGQPPASSTAPAKPPSQPNVLLTKLPVELADTKRTVEIKGQVIRDNRDGTLQIRTEKGDIEVSVNARELNIREGDRVEIEIPPGRPPQTARITQDTQTPAPPPRTTQTPVNIEVRPQQPAPPPAPTTVAEGQIVRLQPVPPEQANQYTPPTEIIASNLTDIAEAAANITAQNAESDLLREIANIIAPPGTSTIAPPVAPPGTPVPVMPPSNIPPPLATPLQNTFPGMPLPSSAVTILNPEIHPIGAAPTHPLLAPQAETIPGLVQPFNPMTMQIASVPQIFPDIQLTPIIAAPLRAEIAMMEASISPAIVTPKIPPSPTIQPEAILKNIEKPLILQNHKAGEIPAMVVGMTPQNLPVIGMISPTTGEELFFIMHMPDASLLPGTQISLVPQQALAGVATPITATVNFAPLPVSFLTPEPWPLMDEIFQALAQLLPQAARAMANITPSPNNPAQIAPSALFFIAAVRGGDLSQWLGSRAIDALQRGGKSGLLARLSQESSSLNKLSSEPVSQDWRGMSVPMMMDNHMHKITLYYKNDSQNDKKDSEGKQTRFVFDLSLDVMGKVQLDGLFRAKRLDLIVRTQQPFSQHVQQDMRKLYAGALDETSITGELSFQNKPEQWVTITPEKRNLGVSI